MNYLTEYFSHMLMGFPLKRTIKHSNVFICQADINNLQPLIDNTCPLFAQNLVILDGLTYRGYHFARSFDLEFLKTLFTVDWSIPANQFAIRRLYECLITQNQPTNITYYMDEYLLTVQIVTRMHFKGKFYLLPEREAYRVGQPQSGYLRKSAGVLKI